MTTRQSPVTAWRWFSRRFTPLYRTLFILSTFAIVLSLFNVGSIRTSISHLGSDPVYAWAGIASTLIVLPLSLAALILLWHKHPLGIRLKLLSYLAAILVTIAGFFTSRVTLQTAIDTSIEQVKRSGASGLDEASVIRIAEFSFYGSLWLAIAASVVFALLWLRAWRRQQRHDKKRSDHKEKNHTK